MMPVRLLRSVYEASVAFIRDDAAVVRALSGRRPNRVEEDAPNIPSAGTRFREAVV
jgi:hypothetical protein